MPEAVRNKHAELAALMLLAFAPAAAPAQDDLARPPSVDAPARSLERPGAARLAGPPERGDDALEEVVVIGEQQRWRLPDLGSEWRREREQARGDARIKADLFRAYDPDDPTNRTDPFPLNGELSRVGFIEMFRIRFGRR